ncbi:MAG: peroxide stress protein YaaA [Gammaproteobacteria bacterium]|nr:peroxide stress protein YaaA [Gammaproteobacteria bacterium]MCP4832655.1 peroxide stress protein YaaA [Gammaproteobacteria bacterium]
MLILISPAKTLDFDTPAITRTATQPVFLEQSQILIDELQEMTPDGISSLMNISENLGNLNFERFMDWHTPFTRDNAKQALLAFKGDVYTGLAAERFSTTDFKFAQKHLRILSGLYGALRPLDLIQAYRLEMGSKFPNPRGKDLYQFWGNRITQELNKQLKFLKTDTLLNLASNEYFKAVDKKLINAEIIAPAFKDLSKGNYKIVSFYAKKARGLMSAWVIQNNITDPKELKKFKIAGYRYDADMSTPKVPTFTRDTIPNKK